MKMTGGGVLSIASDMLLTQILMIVIEGANEHQEETTGIVDTGEDQTVVIGMIVEKEDRKRTTSQMMSLEKRDVDGGHGLVRPTPIARESEGTDLGHPVEDARIDHLETGAQTQTLQRSNQRKRQSKLRKRSLASSPLASSRSTQTNSMELCYKN